MSFRKSVDAFADSTSQAESCTYLETPWAVMATGDLLVVQRRFVRRAQIVCGNVHDVPIVARTCDRGWHPSVQPPELRAGAKQSARNDPHRGVRTCRAICPANSE